MLRGHGLLTSPRTVFTHHPPLLLPPHSMGGDSQTVFFLSRNTADSVLMFHETTHTWFQKLSILYFQFNTYVFHNQICNLMDLRSLIYRLFWRKRKTVALISPPVIDDFNKDGHPIYFVTEIIWDSVINYAYLFAPFRLFICLRMCANLTG